MPFGAKTAEADPAKALAVRQAIADLVDREAIADQVYKGTYTPLYSYVPDGLTGANESLKDLYGDGNGGPDADKAKAAPRGRRRHHPGRAQPAVQPATTTARPRATSTRMIKDQLETSGLFTVNLQSTEWVQYSKDRTADVYPAYQLGWFPDYSDADNYLTPFFLTENFLENHYDNPSQRPDPRAGDHGRPGGARGAHRARSRTRSPRTCPRSRCSRARRSPSSARDVEGVEDTLDASFKFRFGAALQGLIARR